MIGIFIFEDFIAEHIRKSTKRRPEAAVLIVERLVGIVGYSFTDVSGALSI